MCDSINSRFPAVAPTPRGGRGLKVLGGEKMKGREWLYRNTGTHLLSGQVT